jgi:hypothetical protein
VEKVERFGVVEERQKNCKQALARRSRQCLFAIFLPLLNNTKPL